MKWLNGLMTQLRRLPPGVLDGGGIVLSILLCIIALLAQFPGTQVAGVGTNWLLIWVVSWSIKRTPFEGAIAGLCLGLIQDGLTAPYPTHAIGLALAGILTALIQKQRYIQEDFISVALIVFGMAVLTETIIAIEVSLRIQIQDWLPQLLDPGSDSSEILSEVPSPSQEVDPTVVDRVGFTLPEIWAHHQRVALGSAIVSSLWAPIVYYPLNRWWEWLENVRQVK